jgi:hypothetical protein
MAIFLDNSQALIPRIPDEMALHTLEFLTPKEVLVMSRVSKAWSHIDPEIRQRAFQSIERAIEALYPEALRAVLSAHEISLSRLPKYPVHGWADMPVRSRDFYDRLTSPIMRWHLALGQYQEVGIIVRAQPTEECSDPPVSAAAAWIEFLGECPIFKERAVYIEAGEMSTHCADPVYRRFGAFLNGRGVQCVPDLRV